MAGNSPDDPGNEDSGHDDGTPAHGGFRGDKPPPSRPLPPDGEYRSTDKPPPAEPPPNE